MQTMWGWATPFQRSAQAIWWWPTIQCWPIRKESVQKCPFLGDHRSPTCLEFERGENAPILRFGDGLKGWNPETGTPTRERLESLSLGWAADLWD